MAEKKTYMVGNIRLSDLNGFEDTVKQGVRGCFIPYDQNPSLYIGTNRQTGVMTVDMDILVRETRASKTGASHFVKLNIGKANRDSRPRRRSRPRAQRRRAAAIPHPGRASPRPPREATRLPPTPEHRRVVILPRREAERAGRRQFFDKGFHHRFTVVESLLNRQDYA